MTDKLVASRKFFCQLSNKSNKITVFMTSEYNFKLKAVCFIEGSLNSKLPTIWRVEKQMKSR